MEGADFRPLLDVPYFIPPEWQQGHGQNTAALLGCAADRALRRACRRGGGLLGQFTKTGNPNRPGLPEWRRAPYVQGLDLHRVDLHRVGRFDRTAAHNLEFWRAQLPSQ